MCVPEVAIAQEQRNGAVIEIGALFLLPYLFGLCRSRSRSRIRIRVRPRRTSGAHVLIGLAVLIVAIAAVAT